MKRYPAFELLNGCKAPAFAATIIRDDDGTEVINWAVSRCVSWSSVGGIEATLEHAFVVAKTNGFQFNRKAVTK